MALPRESHPGKLDLKINRSMKKAGQENISVVCSYMHRLLAVVSLELICAKHHYRLSILFITNTASRCHRVYNFCRANGARVGQNNCYNTVRITTSDNKLQPKTCLIAIERFAVAW